MIIVHGEIGVMIVERTKGRKIVCVALVTE